MVMAFTALTLSLLGGGFAAMSTKAGAPSCPYPLLERSSSILSIRSEEIEDV